MQRLLHSHRARRVWMRSNRTPSRGQTGSSPLKRQAVPVSIARPRFAVWNNFAQPKPTSGAELSRCFPTPSQTSKHIEKYYHRPLQPDNSRKWALPRFLHWPMQCGNRGLRRVGRASSLLRSSGNDRYHRQVGETCLAHCVKSDVISLQNFHCSCCL